MKNKLGICLSGGFNEELTLEQNISAIADAGFEATFFGWDEKNDNCERAKLCEKYGIEIDNFHAPFAGFNCVWLEGSAGDEYTERIMNCAREAGKLGIKHIIVHPTAGAPEPVGSVIGLERFKRIIDTATNCGVKVCFENLEYPEILGLVMEEFKNENIGFCFDTGHESICTPGMRFIPLYGDKLCCTHIHDNYGASYTKVPIIHGDCHMLPLDGAIDFERVMRDIRSVDYKGVLMIEASVRADLGTYYGFSAKQYYERAYTALKKLSEM